MALDFQPFDTFMGHLGGGRVDLDSDTFKAVLTDVEPLANYDEELGDLTQIVSGNGYTTDGVTLTSVTWTEVSPGVWQFDSADFEWDNNGSGPMAEFRYVVIYSSTSSGHKLVGFYDFGSGLTIPVGAIFRMEPGANGHIQFGQGTIS